MNRRELKSKPLVEAILEFKWELPAQQDPKIETDPHYRLLLGRFSERVESDYPFHEPIPIASTPEPASASTPPMWRTWAWTLRQGSI